MGKDDDFQGKSDPYVKFELEQDNTFRRDKDYGEKKSTKKSNELNPVYDEYFTYSDLPSLNNMELTCKVMDDDLLSDDKLSLSVSAHFNRDVQYFIVALCV